MDTALTNDHNRMSRQVIQNNGGINFNLARLLIEPITAQERTIMKLLRLKKVMEMTGLGRSTIYKYSKEGSFPKQLKLTGKSAAWVESEVLDWISGKLQQREQTS